MLDLDLGGREGSIFVVFVFTIMSLYATIFMHTKLDVVRGGNIHNYEGDALIVSTTYSAIYSIQKERHQEEKVVNFVRKEKIFSLKNTVVTKVLEPNTRHPVPRKGVLPRKDFVNFRNKTRSSKVLKSRTKVRLKLSKKVAAKESGIR